MWPWWMLNWFLLVGGIASGILIWLHARQRLTASHALLWGMLSYILFPIAPLLYFIVIRRSRTRS